MLKGRDRARFALEPFARRRRIGQQRRQHLECDVPFEPDIAGAIDLAHAI